jgi:hypothetical protein
LEVLGYGKQERPTFVFLGSWFGIWCKTTISFGLIFF